MNTYILNESREAVPEADPEKWSRWMFQYGERWIAQDYLSGGVLVSTIFLGLDHQWTVGLPPLLFETMIFKGPMGGYQKRYESYELALIGHMRAVEMAIDENSFVARLKKNFSSVIKKLMEIKI